MHRRGIERRGGGSAAIATLLLIVLGCAPAGPAPTDAGSTTNPPGITTTPAESQAPSAATTPAATTSSSSSAASVPLPPAPAPLPAGSPDEQAAALASAVLPGGQAALAPLLRAYDAAGLPVIGADEQPVVGPADDPVGLPWWMVWLSAAGNPAVRVPLADALKPLVAMEQPPDLDPAAMANAVLADLREMAADEDSQRRFFARFVSAMAAAGGADPLDPAATTDTVMLNGMALAYLHAGVLRGAIAGLVAADPDGYALRAAPLAALGGAWLAPVPRAVTSQAGSPCNFSGTSEQVAYWTQFVASRLAAGLELPGMRRALPGLVELVTRSRTIGTRVGAAASWGGAVLNALGMMIQMTNIDAAIDVQPVLYRTKSAAQDGAAAVLKATISFDLKGSSVDGGEGVANCMLLLLNALGIQASLPTDGPLPGASMRFKPGTGFNDFVQTVRAGSQLTQDTRQDGTALLDIEGIHQRQQVPDYAPEWPREATIGIESTVEPTNERSIATSFINGLVARVSGPAGALSAIIDVLKTVKWDVGELSFLVIDWLVGWYLDDPFSSGGATGHVRGQKCGGPEGQWVAEGQYKVAIFDGNQVWNIDIDMQSPTAGRGLFNYSDVQIGSAVAGIQTILTYNSSGEVDLLIDAEGMAHMNMRETMRQVSVTTVPGGGQGGPRDAPLQGFNQIWRPGGDCDPPQP